MTIFTQASVAISFLLHFCCVCITGEIDCIKPSAPNISLSCINKWQVCITACDELCTERGGHDVAVDTSEHVWENWEENASMEQWKCVYCGNPTMVKKNKWIYPPPVLRRRLNLHKRSCAVCCAEPHSTTTSKAPMLLCKQMLHHHDGAQPLIMSWKYNIMRLTGTVKLDSRRYIELLLS